MITEWHELKRTRDVPSGMLTPEAPALYGGAEVSRVSLPVAYLHELLAVLVEDGASIAGLLDGLPIDETALAVPETRVPFQICEAVLGRAVALTQDPALAVRVGERMRLSSHGFLGFAAMMSATLQQALEIAARYAPTRTPAIALTLFTDNTTASLIVEERADMPPLVREFVVIAFLVSLARAGRQLTGLTLLVEIESALHGATTQRTPIRFDAPLHRIVFAREYLDLSIASADPTALKLVCSQCERELAQIDGDLATRVRGFLSNAYGSPSLEDVARSLRISPRTLKRRLTTGGITFREIRDDVRRQRALLLLANPSLSVGEIAARLGYTEIANFTRAFRKWTGMTPYVYRKRRESR